jgi:two-component system, LytTR family, sensor kinase
MRIDYAWRTPDAGGNVVDMRPDIASGALVDDRPPTIRWRYVVGAFALATVLRFSYFYFDDLARQVHGTLLHRLLEEATGNIASALLFPIAVIAERRFPLDRGRWRRTWPIHALGYVAYSLAHTTIIAGLRALAFPLAGQGAYDYGSMPARYVMESAQDFFSYAMFVGVLTLLRVQQHLRDKERRTVELQRDAANARLESLSLRLQPHFLFNALNTISSTAYLDPVATDELIGRLGELLRQSLRTTDRQEIPLAEELSVLHAYQALVEARFGERVRFAFDVDPAATALAVPAFLLQPLVENAVQHGAALEYGNTSITIHASTKDAMLVLIVENDSPATFDASRTGTGLGTTRDRLALLYGGDAELEVNGDGTVFRVTVRIPAHVAPPSLTVADEHARAHR